jgi:2-oxoglutarate dehydrogenase E1 component
MAEGTFFHRVLWDDAETGGSTLALRPDAEIKRVVLCSGKVYYDLLEARDAQGLSDVYILRLEQFYPFPAMSLTKELGRFRDAEVVWCQEEPKNQGGWSFVEPNIEWVLGRIGAKAGRARYAGRPASASPATGLASKHRQEQEDLVAAALAG